MESRKASYFHSIIINIIVWFLKKYKNYFLTDSKNEYTICLMNQKEFKEYAEFKSHCYVIYENKEELLKDNPNAKEI